MTLADGSEMFGADDVPHIDRRSEGFFVISIAGIHP